MINILAEMNDAIEIFVELKEQGPPGNDAEVTKENITLALGHEINNIIESSEEPESNTGDWWLKEV